jgi:hypothetical protein
MAARKLAEVRFLSPTTPPEEGRRREQAFQNWLSSTETAFLECRNGRHIFPGMTDRGTDLEVRQGMCYVEAACPRCGTVLKSVIGIKDGFLTTGSKASYEYPDGYLLPKEATGQGGSAMDKEHRAKVRLEILDRGLRAKGTSLAKEKKRADSASARAARKPRGTTS